MNLPPQVAAVQRQTHLQGVRTGDACGILPTGKPTGEAISCWGPNPKALVCKDSHNNPIGAACCPNSTTTVAMEDGVCVCQ